MNDNTLSVIRHILTGLSVLAMALGLAKFAGIIDFTLVNLDGVWQAVLTIGGFLGTIFGFKFGRTPATPPAT